MTPPEADPDIATVERILWDRIGLDPSSLGRGPIAQALAARRRVLGLVPGSYAEVLAGSEDEQQAIVEEVIVPESWFFRDRIPFDHLAQAIAPAWRDHPARSPLRLLCLPCAGGEEPYSVVMTLLDAGLTADRFRVRAIDVSHRELERARRGVYRPHSFRGVEPTVRDRHFELFGSEWRVKAPVRQLVSWSQGNLIDSTSISHSEPYDIVFCRNLLIYLHDEAKQRAVEALAGLVAPGGTLFVGHAEASLPIGPNFRPTGKPGSFAFLRTASDPLIAPVPILAQPPRRINASRPDVGSLPWPGRIQSSHPRSPSLLRPPMPRTAEAAKLPNDSVMETAERASELANQGAWDEALAMASRVVARSPFDPVAHVVRGSIEQAAGRADQAESSFRRAVYLDGHCVEALLALAALVEARGDLTAAANYRRRADREAQRELEA